MITLHRLGHQAEEFQLNPDLIVTVEANPDTVVTLTTGTKIVVAETPDRVVREIRQYRMDILSGALSRRREVARSEPHGVHARRAAQGMLLSIDRAERGTTGGPGSAGGAGSADGTSSVGRTPDAQGGRAPGAPAAPGGPAPNAY